MGKLIVVLALLCSIPRGAAAQCCGDCNGDGLVAINELVTAVNNALSNCGMPTPTPEASSTPTRRPTATPTPSDRCPFGLDSNGGGACGFRGRYNQGCGTELNSVLTTDGLTVVVSIDTMLSVDQTVLFAADVVDATTANLTAWSSDDFQTINITAGQLQLTDERGQLVIFPNDPPFMIQGCTFVRYAGAYTGQRRAANSLADASARATALDRLRAWRERPVPELADP